MPEGKRNFDGWAMKRRGKVDISSIETVRPACISAFLVNFPGYSWPHMRRRGWSCVKVRVVEVENEA